jgi:hypothetical protein
MVEPGEKEDKKRKVVNKTSGVITYANLYDE